MARIDARRRASHMQNLLRAYYRAGTTSQGRTRAYHALSLIIRRLLARQQRGLLITFAYVRSRISYYTYSLAC